MPIDLTRPPNPPSYPPTGRIQDRLVIYKPPVTPIYPSPIPPVVSRSATPLLRGVAPKLLGAARVASSFKAPPGLGFVARRVVPFAGRAIPGVGWAFVALDSFLIACAAGWLPGNICPRPDSPAPGGSTPGFSGGQCGCVVYDVFCTFFQGSPAVNGYIVTQTSARILGKIGGTWAEPNNPTNVELGYVCQGSWTEPCQPYPYRIKTNNSGYTKDGLKPYLRIDNIVRVGGGADNCGDPQPAPQPRMPDVINNFYYHNSNININITLPSFVAPTPTPKTAPRVVAPPAPLPEIHNRNGENFSSNFESGENGDFHYDLQYLVNPNPGGNYVDFADIYNNFSPSPQPRPNYANTLVAVQVPPPNSGATINVPEIPPPLSDKLPEDATESDKYQFRQNKEAIDKLYRLNAEVLDIQKSLAKQNQILENLQKLLDFEVEGSQIIKRCDDVEFVYSYKEKILPAINRQLSHVKSIEQIILDEVCEIENAAVVASPEWWQVRIQGDIPQIVLIFRFLTTRTYHKLVVPHPLSTDKLVNPPIKTYKKGNWQGEIVNIDNTKFLCNCGTKGEAIRLLDIAASLINPIFLGDPIRKYYAERKGKEVSPGDMLATSAMYFPTGQRNMRPEWRVAFTKDAQ